MDQSESRRILHDRAVELAREYAAAVDDADGIDVTVFRLGNELYAFESSLIREIVPLKGYTPLPCVPPFIAGITNLRGRILSLLNLHRLFELPDEAEENNRSVVVLAHDGMEFGIIAGAVEGVAHVAFSALQAELPTLQGSMEKYLRGVTAERLIVLDGLALLHDPALVVNEEIT
jgi:purine-binding chemotaxis protein CheW